ncbi:ABC transporter ATP-binding protein [Gorillibacterium timonense]|uniref:ABC transporter ATP-binding protein n=1 Tax=Gorillibacterium timonense TaxID=1689269 RepID=UPI001F273049|nr:ABC transporter ATP-binding protein [Gorillibacterium timonense]
MICLQSNPIIVLLSLLFSIIGGFIPYLLVKVNGRFIDSVLAYINNHSSRSLIYMPLLGLLFLFLVSYVIGVFSQLLNVRLLMGLRSHFHTKIIRKSVRMKYQYIEDSNTCDLVNRVVENPGMNAVHAVFISLTSFVTLGIQLCSIALLLISHQWWLFPLMILVSFPLIVVSYLTGIDTYKSLRWNSEIARKSNYIEFDVLRGRDLAAERNLFGYSGYFNEKFDRYIQTAIKFTKDVKRKWLWRDKAAAFAIIVTGVIVTLAFLPLLKSNMISIGFFISIVTAVYQMQDNLVTNIPETVRSLSENSGYFRDLSAFVQLEEQNQAEPDADEYNLEIETIEFKDVYFKYPGTEQMIVKGLSFTLKKGGHYSFVGKNGSGKSTITKLLLGLYDVDQGSILINGKNINEFGRNQLYSLFSVVYQDFAKYSIPAKDNIGIGHIEQMNDRNRIEEVAEFAGVKDVINQLPNQFDTPLGKVLSCGVDISGGQWQRIALARSLMKENTFKILDEPTSALDPIEESRLYKQYSQISKNETTLFISHRLGSTKLADVIMVLDNGQIVASGSHEQLMNENGIYKEMFTIQKEWYDEA